MDCIDTTESKRAHRLLNICVTSFQNKPCKMNETNPFPLDHKMSFGNYCTLAVPKFIFISFDLKKSYLAGINCFKKCKSFFFG